MVEITNFAGSSMTTWLFIKSVWERFPNTFRRFRSNTLLSVLDFFREYKEITRTPHWKPLSLMMVFFYYNVIPKRKSKKWCHRGESNENIVCQIFWDCDGIFLMILKREIQMFCTVTSSRRINERHYVRLLPLNTYVIRKLKHKKLQLFAIWSIF